MTGPRRATPQEALQKRRDIFFAQYPKAKVVDTALKSNDNPSPLFFLSSDTSHADLKNVGFAIGRLGPDIERQFLINGEIAFFFAPWRDFQRRSFNVMTKGLIDFSRDAQSTPMGSPRFTPSSRVAVLISEDAQAQAKIDEWHLDTSSPTVLVPIYLETDDPEAARREIYSRLRSSLGDRDLYRTQNPVTGDDFFGRQPMLRSVSAAMRSDENVAILGLRRSGKTSVLRELKRQLLPRGVVVTLGDLQVLQQDSVESLARSIARNLVDDLRDARAAGLDIKAGDQREQQVDENLSLPALSDRLKRIGNRNPNIRIVVAIDEIESAARIAKDDPSQIRTLLGSLRSAAQACSNVSLAFAGVANRLFRETVLGADSASVDNPMFGQVSSIYITAFTGDETGDLLRRLGRPMFLNWTDDAVSEVQDATGGMPYFVRDLASAVRSSVKSGPDFSDFEVTSISADHVRAVLPEWRKDAGHDWLRLVQALGLHYPEAAELLEPTLSRNELDQWIRSDAVTRDAAEDLSKLGLLTQEDGQTWSRTRSLQAIHELVAERPSTSEAREVVPSLDTEEGAHALIRSGEGQELEFKETFRVNARTGEKDRTMESEIVRAITAFMNASGGILLVGVHDSGEIKGLQRDLGLFQNNLDRFERWLLGDLLGKRIDTAIVSESVRVKWLKLHGVQVCALQIEKARETAWINDSELHLRTGNQTLKLEGRKLASFISRAT